VERLRGHVFGTFFTNSLMMCAAAIIGNLISCSMAAYAFARLKFAGKRFWFAVMMATLMLPAHVTLVPRYILFNTFGWVGGYLPILVPKFLAVDAFFVFLLVQFMRSLPVEIEEAAIIDGCGKIGVFLRIILPLSTPALVTTALFTFLWTWTTFSTTPVPDKAGHLHRVQGIAHVCRRCGRGIQLGWGSGDGHAFNNSRFHPVLLPAEILRTGHHNHGPQGIAQLQEHAYE